MKIGFVADGFILWSGGQDVFRQIIQSYLELGSKDQIHIIVPIKGIRYETAFVLKKIRDLVFNAKKNYPSRPSILKYIQEIVLCAEDEFKVSIKIDCIDSGISSLGRFCDKSKIDILLPSLYPLPKNFPTPWIGYITDFQHRKEPHFFSRKEIIYREVFFKKMLSSARAVLVNSTVVASEADNYYEGHFAKLFALPFNAGYPRINISDEDNTINKYGLNKPYFIVSNQFWEHKDHETAMRAFAKVVLENKSLLLVFTGATFDPRNPNNMEKINNLASSLGIISNMKILGLIPKSDQLALLKAAVAVLQPSKSEGGPGGGSAYDAIGLGVKVILSDIPVNLEIKNYDVEFFPVGNFDVLSKIMSRVLGEPRQRSDIPKLISNGRSRQKICGELIRSSIDFTLE